MSDNNDSNRVKGTSVAGFLLMPQFRLCFKGFAHVYPVFMRTLAMMFAQSKLIPANHPALFYGAQGVPDTSISELFGEAWFTLRATRATTYQWGMFTSVIMMMATMTAAVATFLARVCFGLGEVAQAQIFSHPCDPYTAGGGSCGGASPATGPTDIATVSAITAPGSLFDSRVNGNGISSDYALMVLDKILRQAATGSPGNGGALQNALANLMGVYNSGVLLVAGAIIFWMIMSIVVDTAKTGVFGGGRHNMVWTPIRVVFALGIMIPLGTQGFSSGQYMVMKLAEWGSNFGSQGWVAYVGGVTADKSLIAPFSPNNATSLVSGVSKTLLCQVVYNSYLQQSTGGLDPQQVIVAKQDAANHVGQVVNRYTNATGANICGTITYSKKGVAGEDNAAILAGTGSAITTPMDAASVAAANTGSNRTDMTNTNATLATAMTDFRESMLGALEGVMDDSTGSVITTGRSWACKFAARRFANGGTASNQVGNSGNCPAGFATPATEPDSADQVSMLKDIQNAIGVAYDGNTVNPPGSVTTPPPTSAKGAFMTYVNGGMMPEMRKRGWAGMGMWYQDISNMNGVAQGAKEPSASVEPGSVWTSADSGSMWQCAGSKLMGRACKESGLEEKVMTVLGDYDRWWEANSAPSAANPANPTVQRNQDLNQSSSGGVKSLISLVRSSSPGDNGLLNWLAVKLWGRGDDVFFIHAVDESATNTYPLAQLAEAGHSVIWNGLGILATLTLLQTLSTISIPFLSAGAGFAVSALAGGMASLATTLIVAGIMIAFYLPILPFLRVAFAVLTWATSVFQAVVMVPIAALAHLSSEGEGLAGGARTAWILWLNVLMRPILVVFGFVAGMLIFNTFAVYFHTTFNQGAASVIAANTNPIMHIIAVVAFSVIYLGTLYTAANMSFKLLDVFPDALMRWMGGQADHSMDDHSDGKMMAATQMLGQMTPQFKSGAGGKGGGGKKTGATQA